MPKRKSKQSEEAARRTSPRKPKLQLVGEETEKEHRSPPPATKKPAEKPKIIRPPPTKVSNVAKKRKTQRVSLVESDSDVESIEPEEPEIARKQPTRASPVKHLK